MANSQYYDPEKAKEVVQNDSISKKKIELKPAAEITKKLYYGAIVQFNSTRRGTLLELSPLIGYNITDKFSAGLMFTCIYFKPVNFYGIGIFGVTPFLKFEFSRDFYAIGELCNINYPSEFSVIGVEKRVWETNPMLGLGYSVSLSEKFAFNTALMYNLNHLKSKIYGSFVMRVGFTFRIYD